MPWRNAYALHIFAPNREPYGDNWVEQILGAVIRPLQQQYTDDIRWMWVTRYSDQYDENNPPRGYAIPEEHYSDGRYRFIVFRVSVVDTTRNQLHEEAIQLATQAGCFTEPAGWVNYDVVDDLGSDRFIAAGVDMFARTNRARLVAHFVDIAVRLMLDSLTQTANSKWVMEPSSHHENPNGSFFESVHHLFCNITGVPTTVLLSRDNEMLSIRTFWSNPISLPVQSINNVPLLQVPIHF